MEPTSTALSGINFHSMEQMEIFISELEKKKKIKNRRSCIYDFD